MRAFWREYEVHGHRRARRSLPGRRPAAPKARYPDCCFDEARAPVGRLLGGSLSTSELAQSHATATTAAPGGAAARPTGGASREHRLVMCRDDAVVGRARHDRWLSSEAVVRPAAMTTDPRAGDGVAALCVPCGQTGLPPERPSSGPAGAEQVRPAARGMKRRRRSRGGQRDLER